MEAEQTRFPKYLLYPDPVRTVTGPIVRNLKLTPKPPPFLLGICAFLVKYVPFISKLLYLNSGFSRLSKFKGIHLRDYRPDPTVIPLSVSPTDEPWTPGTSIRLNEASIQQDLSQAKDRYYTVMDYHNSYLDGKITPSDVVEALLPMIQRDIPTPSKHSVAFLQVRANLVRQAAREATERFSRGSPIGILDGVPIVVKEDVDLEGYKSSVGSKIDFTNPLNETAWYVRMVLNEGAVIIGKSNMHELGLDTTNNNPYRGTPRNPHCDMYYTGGSSGGTAYALSSGIVPVGFGSDGGGSVRLPSSFCGVFGLKTSHGRVSSRPGMRAALSTGVHGPMATNMADLELAYRVMARPDPGRANSALFEPPRSAMSLSAKDSPKILGVYQEWIDQAELSVRETCMKAIDYFVNQRGYYRVGIQLPYLAEGAMSHAVTILSEIAAVIRPEVRPKLSAPNRILLEVASQATAQDLVAAQRFRNIIMEHLAYLFELHPSMVIVSPTTPIPGWPIANPAVDLKTGIVDTAQSMRNMEYVWIANLTGIPALSVPVGYLTPSKGQGQVPVGLMGMAQWGDEHNLLAWGYEAERYIKAKEGLDSIRRPAGWVDVLEEAARVKQRGTAALKTHVENLDSGRSSSKKVNVKAD